MRKFLIMIILLLLCTVSYAAIDKTLTYHNSWTALRGEATNITLNTIDECDSARFFAYYPTIGSATDTVSIKLTSFIGFDSSMVSGTGTFDSIGSYFAFGFTYRSGAVLEGFCGEVTVFPTMADMKTYFNSDFISTDSLMTILRHYLVYW